VATPTTFSKSFAPSFIPPGGKATLTFTITHPAGNPVTLTGVSFVDTLPASPGAMVVASPPNVQVSGCGSPTVTAVAASGQIAMSGGTIVVGGICTVSVDVTAPVVGSYANTSGPTTSQELGAGATASATLVVGILQPLTMTKSFNLSDVVVGGLSTMTITITNPNPVTVTDVAVSDTYPTGGHPVATSLTDDVTGLVSNTSSLPTNTCSGTLVADAVAGQVDPSTQINHLKLSGGSIPAGGQCKIEAQVFACPGGNYINSTADLTSSAGTTPPATALLKVSCPVGNTYTGNTGSGDLNCDGIVNTSDLTVVTSKFGRTRLGVGWDPAADPNCDGIVNTSDLTIVTSKFGRTY